MQVCNALTFAFFLVLSTADNSVKMGNRYAMALFYWEQLTMATNNWIQLALVAKYWGAYCIRPFTGRSFLYGLPSAGYHCVNVMYDPVELDHKLAEYSIPPIANFDEFIAKAGRNVILVKIDYQKPKLHIEKCEGIGFNSTLSLLNKEASRRGYSNFSLNRCCLVHGQHPTNPVDIAKGCSLDQMDEYTVIIPEWRGLTRTQNHRLLNLNIGDNSYPHYKYDIYPHSKEVIGNATAYINESTGGGDFIALHYRLEAFLRRHNSKLTGHCLQHVPEAIRQIQADYPHLKHLFIFGDDAFSQARADGRFQMKEEVSNFPRGSFGSIDDRGFVGQVEQNVMSRAKVLITAGCGSFQAETVSRFNREPGHIKHHHACHCE